MKNQLNILTIAACALLPCAHATTIVRSYDFPGLNLGIPDGNPSGLANVQNISDNTVTAIEEITVSLSISGSWNGDIYATLQHSSGFAVLLNRVGRTATDAFGYGDAGFDIVLKDHGVFNDVHSYQDVVGPQGPLTGTWASDGRLIDPDLVVDTDPRAALLTNFDGLDATGDWTLFVADLSSGDTHTLNGWGMEITGIPEPGTGILALMGAVLLLRRRR